MNKKTIEQIRQIVDSDNWPLDFNEWPEELNKSTNCLAFVLGLPIPDKNYKLFNGSNAPIKEDILEFFKIMHLEWREITDIQDAENDEIIIQGYEFWQTLAGEDFHIVRRNLNGNWVHKPGWNRAPSIIENLNDLHCHMHPDGITCIFAVKKRTS